MLTHVKSRGWVGPGGKCIGWSCLWKPSTPPTPSVFGIFHLLSFLRYFWNGVCMLSSPFNCPGLYNLSNYTTTTTTITRSEINTFVQFEAASGTFDILCKLNKTCQSASDCQPVQWLMISMKGRLSLSSSGCLLLLLCNWSLICIFIFVIFVSCQLNLYLCLIGICICVTPVLVS